MQWVIEGVQAAKWLTGQGFLCIAAMWFLVGISTRTSFIFSLHVLPVFAWVLFWVLWCPPTLQRHAIMFIGSCLTLPSMSIQIGCAHVSSQAACQSQACVNKTWKPGPGNSPRNFYGKGSKTPFTLRCVLGAFALKKHLKTASH